MSANPKTTVTTMRRQAAERVPPPVETPVPVPYRPPLPGEAKATTRLVRWLRYTGERDRATLADFTGRLAEDPDNAFRWGQDAIAAAGRGAVTGRIAFFLAKYGVETVLTEMTADCLRAARTPEHSTSPMSNLMSEARTAALADMLVEVSR